MAKKKKEQAKEYELFCYGKTFKVNVITDKYVNNGTLAIILKLAGTGEQFAVMTVNIDEPGATDTRAYVDVNNCIWAEQFIRENDLGHYVGYQGRSGWCSYPLYEFNLKK